MANITQAFTVKYGLSLSDLVGVFVTTTNPITTSEAAPKGSIILYQPTTSAFGEIYLKYGTGNSDWVKLFDRKCNLIASTEPTTTNDNTQNYYAGSIWLNTTTDIPYMCVDETTGNAIWKPLVDTYQLKVNNTDTTPNYLIDKVVAGKNVHLEVLDNSGNKTLQINSNQPLWLSAAMMGSAASSIGIFSKSSVAANPSSYSNPITNPYGNYIDGAVDPYIIPFNYTITEVYITVGRVAVSGATVGSNPVLRIEFFKHSASSRTSLGSADLPINPANCGIYNNLGGNNFQKSEKIGLNITGSAGDIIGWQFTNLSSTNNEINAIAQCTTTVKIEEII